MHLAFMGTPDFAVPVLRALVAAGHGIARVYTRPPAPAGRGKALRPSAVAVAAARLGLPVETPERFRDAAVAGLAALGADAAVVVAYGQLLPPDALAAPRLGCWNLHASLLPRWRGAAPIQRAIMAGDAETGVSVMRMEAGLDTGPVLATARVPIGPEDTAGSLHDRLAGLGAGIMVQALGMIAEGRTPVPQPAEGVTYAARIAKAEARIDWTRPAAAVSAHLRGLSPFPGAWFPHGAERIKVLNARIAPGSGIPGTVLDGGAGVLLVATGAGAVELTRLQRAGREALPAEAVLRGLPLPPGTRLG